MPETTIQRAFFQALRHHGKGQLNEAESIYRQILGVCPRHADSLHYLGVIAHQVGRSVIAADLIRQSIAIAPDSPEAQNNLGNALKDNGQLDEAFVAYRQAITLKPDFPEAHNNLGTALNKKGQLDEALASYRQAIVLKPNYPEAYYNLGKALKDDGQLDEAIEAYCQAIALNPGFSQAHNNLGDALRAKGQLDEAVAACRQAIALRPAYPEAYFNLGIALNDKGQLDEALAAYREAIILKPAYPEAYNSLGKALKDGGQLNEALAACRQALALKPNYPEAYNNLGNALKDKGQLNEALAAYREAITLKPDFPEAQNNLGIALNDQDQLDEAAAAYRNAIALKPDFPQAYANLGNTLKNKGQLDDAIAAYRQAIALKPDFSEAHSNLVFTMNYHPGFEASAIADEARRWDQQHAQPLRRFIHAHANDRTPDRRLRIGYVSPDFREHPVGYFMLPLLENHDHSQFEIFCYARAAVPDSITARARACADQWRSTLGQTDQQLADLIRQDGIDILVDLALHTEHNRLLVFGRKPAPVQVTYLAYAGSSGLETMDYRLSDRFLDPSGLEESVYSEQTLRLAQTYWCYNRIEAPPVGPMPALTTGHITFGCLNNFCKVTAPTLTMWASLLIAVPGAQLLLHAPDSSHHQGITDRLSRFGVDSSRVRFAGKVSLSEYLQLYHQIDIALDPFPYGGGTTSCDALWMGVPVVSCAGTTAVSRAGLSILSNLGLYELVAKSADEYVQLAVQLANDLPRLAGLRSTLRQRMQSSPLMDAPQFARDIEAAYRQMWRTWCEH